MKKTIQPQSLWDPQSRYSQGVVVEPRRLLFIAGQTAVDSAGNIVGQGDIEAQTSMILQNIKAIVEEAGGSLTDLVATTAYVTGADHLNGFYKARREFFKEALPTSTTVIVKGLARSEYLVEIQAVAAVGER
jgi:enamine deaminase RidA (YjgF/YER057c/UK114 family)